MTRLLTALLVALPLAAAAQEAAHAAAEPQPVSARERARTGFELGRLYGGVGVAMSALSEGGGDNGAAGWRFRLGLPRSPRLALGVEAGFVSGAHLDATWYDVGATFFPWGKYFYLRGAAGLSLLSRWDPGWTGQPGFWSSEQGPNLLLGLGVALGRPRGVTVTLNLDAQTHFTSLGGGAARRMSAGSFWLGLDWY